jgi:CheY-specific phosphatase CheX
VSSESTTEALPHSDAVGEAVKEIMMMACGTMAETCDEIGDDVGSDGVIISVISIMGAVDWSIYVSLPRDTAEQLAQAFCGFEIPFDSEDMGDAIGEVTNILGGNVKQLLDKRGVEVDISLPSVMRVDGLHVLKQRDSASSKTCYKSSVGQFSVGVVAGKSAGIVG